MKEEEDVKAEHSDSCIVLVMSLMWYHFVMSVRSGFVVFSYSEIDGHAHLPAVVPSTTSVNRWSRSEKTICASFQNWLVTATVRWVNAVCADCTWVMNVASVREVWDVSKPQTMLKWPYLNTYIRYKAAPPSLLMFLHTLMGVNSVCISLNSVFADFISRLACQWIPE